VVPRIDGVGTGVVLGACPYDRELDAEALREELLSEDAPRLLRFTMKWSLSAGNVTELFLEAAESLEAILASEVQGAAR
jgi:hypothetical protein